MDNFDDDIIWDNPDDNKKKPSKPPRQRKKQPKPESPIEQPIEETRPVPPRTPQEQAQTLRRTEQIYYERINRQNYRPLSPWENFENGFLTYLRYDWLLRNIGGLIMLGVFFIFFTIDTSGIPSPRRAFWNRLQQVQRETNTEENTQAQQQTSSQEPLVNSMNKALYSKNFSTVSQAILLLQAEGRYCSFTSLGLANCFATQLNVSKQSGNVLYLADGAIYTFDCNENHKCTLNVDLNANNAPTMPIPLSADDNGNIVINKKDVERFLND